MSETLSVDCPLCGRFFDPGFISQHANSCLNQASEKNESKNRKRRNTDWDFMKGYSKNDNKTCANSAKMSKPVQSKGKSKVVNVLSNTEKLLIKGAENRNEASSSSDVEFVDEIQEQVKDRESVKSGKDQQGDLLTQNMTVMEKLTGSVTTSGTINTHTGTKNSNTNTKVVMKDTTNTKTTHQGKNMPLAEKARPHSFDSFVGQDQAVGEKSILHSLIMHSNNVPSMILWGPPGCGKTTLAKIVAQRCKDQGNIKFITMSATSASVSDVKEVAKVATNDQKMFRKKTILFLDEIHRFNKAQQDVLLPYVEDGTITLIGATTENPSFYVNGALLSRCRVITLEKLKIEDITAIIKRALPLMGVRLQEGDDDGRKEKDDNEMEDNSFPSRSVTVVMETAALETLAGLVDGDARAALNGLQLAVEGSLIQRKQQQESDHINLEVTITVDIVKEALQRSHVLYDKAGEEHYNTISALIKSMRGSDASAALYWMVRILEGGENPLFIARRLVIFASEDVGLADPLALTQAVSTHQACHTIGMPECSLNLAHCVIYLARAPKSNEVLQGLEAARNCVRNQQGALPPVPLHLRNASTKLMKSLGYGKDYKYPPDYSGPVEQNYFPPSLIGTDFFTKT